MVPWHHGAMVTLSSLFFVWGVIFWGGLGPGAGQLDSRFIIWNRHNYLGGLGRGSPQIFLGGYATKEWSIIFFMIIMCFLWSQQLKRT